MKKQKRIYKARLVYFFPCDNCGKPQAQTFHRKTKKAGLCRNCKRRAVPKNQMALSL